MTPEVFKGDETELKFVSAEETLFDVIGIGLDDFNANGYSASPFLLMLYDEKRVPFSERVNKNAFVDFIKETLSRFPFIGSFDTYLFVLKAIFGVLSEINFEEISPGKLGIDINATSNLEFEFVARDFDGTLHEMVTLDDEPLIFRAVAGIETAYELELLFSEIMPCGITPEITLTFFVRYDFVAEYIDGDIELTNMIDHLGNQIIFNEVG